MRASATATRSEIATTMSTNGNVGFARLFFGDAAIVFMLLNNARHRTVTRVFGVSRDDSNLVTVLVIGSAAVAVHGTAARVRAIRPSRSDSLVGAAVLREAALGIAGEPSRAVPAAGALLALALVGKSSRPILRGVVRTTRESVQNVMTAPLKLRAFARGRYDDS
jgi:hypothetical protein